MIRFLFIVIFVLLLASCRKDGASDITPSVHTVIVYMAADNDLSEDAINDIEEMKQGFSGNSANLIVFADFVGEAPCMLKIGKNTGTKVKTYPELNSADAGNMQQVLNDVIALYPAESYGLILWSHGTSWLPAGSRLKSFGEDGGRQLNIPALAAALPPVRFDFILMDACLMGTVEVAYELRNKTDFIVASSTETVYEGFPYNAVIPPLLQPKADPVKVAQSYFDYYSRQQGAYRSATVSVVDCREMEPLAEVTGLLVEGTDMVVVTHWNRTRS